MIVVMHKSHKLWETVHKKRPNEFSMFKHHTAGRRWQFRVVLMPENIFSFYFVTKWRVSELETRTNGILILRCFYSLRWAFWLLMNERTTENLIKRWWNWIFIAIFAIWSAAERFSCFLFFFALSFRLALNGEQTNVSVDEIWKNG